MRGNHIDEVAKSEGLFINQTKSVKRERLCNLYKDYWHPTK